MKAAPHAVPRDGRRLLGIGLATGSLLLAISPARADNPPPPSAVLGTLSSRGLVRLWWVPVAGARGYILERRAPGRVVFDRVARLDGTRIFFRERFPGRPSEVYWYRVRSILPKGGLSGPGRLVRISAVPSQAQQARIRRRSARARSLLGLLGRSVWQSTHWDGETAPQKVVLVLQALPGEVRSTLTVGDGSPQQFRGQHDKERGVIEGDGLRVEFFADRPNLAGVEVLRADRDPWSFLMSRTD